MSGTGKLKYVGIELVCEMAIPIPQFKCSEKNNIKYTIKYQKRMRINKYQLIYTADVLNRLGNIVKI